MWQDYFRRRRRPLLPSLLSLSRQQCHWDSFPYIVGHDCYRSGRTAAILQLHWKLKLHVKAFWSDIFYMPATAGRHKHAIKTQNLPLCLLLQGSSGDNNRTFVSDRSKYRNWSNAVLRTRQTYIFTHHVLLAVSRAGNWGSTAILHCSKTYFTSHSLPPYLHSRGAGWYTLCTSQCKSPPTPTRE